MLDLVCQLEVFNAKRGKRLASEPGFATIVDIRDYWGLANDSEDKSGETKMELLI